MCLERIVGVARVGVQSFVQNTAHTTSPNGSSLTFATVAVLRLNVPAALGLALGFTEKADEAVFAPTSVPGVTDDPVVSVEAIISTVTRKDDSMV